MDHHTSLTINYRKYVGPVFVWRIQALSLECTGLTHLVLAPNLLTYIIFMYNRLVNPLNLELLNQAKNILVLETKFSNQFCFLLNNLRKLCLGQNFQDLSQFLKNITGRPRLGNPRMMEIEFSLLKVCSYSSNKRTGHFLFYYYTGWPSQRLRLWSRPETLKMWQSQGKIMYSTLNIIINGLLNDLAKKQTRLQLQGIVNIRKQTV